MNAKQKRRSIRYWRYTVELYDSMELDIERCEWLVKNFGRNNKGRRYVWASWNPTYFQFHNEKDYVAFVLRWAQ
jgi:hypothetical protein